MPRYFFDTYDGDRSPENGRSGADFVPPESRLQPLAYS